MNGSSLVENIPSATGRYRVETRRRPDGLLQVHLLRWTEEVVPGHGKVAEFWEQVPTAASITDDLSRAVELAKELLATHDRP